MIFVGISWCNLEWIIFSQHPARCGIRGAAAGGGGDSGLDGDVSRTQHVMRQEQPPHLPDWRWVSELTLCRKENAADDNSNISTNAAASVDSTTVKLINELTKAYKPRQWPPQGSFHLSSDSEPFREDFSTSVSHRQFDLVSLSWLFRRQKETGSLLLIHSWHFHSQLCKCMKVFVSAGGTSAAGDRSQPAALTVSDVRPVKSRRPWSCYVLVAYLALLTAIIIFLISKGEYVFLLKRIQVISHRVFCWKWIKRLFFSLPVSVVTLECQLSNLRSQKLTCSDVCQGGGRQVDETLQTLLLNNSQQTRILWSQLWVLQSQVLLMFLLDISVLTQQDILKLTALWQTKPETKLNS